MKSRRNKLAGKHPSYEGMSNESIERKKAYDKRYHAPPSVSDTGLS